jgi:hypothetical protein
MSRIDNVVFVNGFKRGQEDIEDAFEKHDTVYVQASGEAIETAIALTEFLVRKESKTPLKQKSLPMNAFSPASCRIRMESTFPSAP